MTSNFTHFRTAFRSDYLNRSKFIKYNRIHEIHINWISIYKRRTLNIRQRDYKSLLLVTLIVNETIGSSKKCLIVLLKLTYACRDLIMPHSHVLLKSIPTHAYVCLCRSYEANKCLKRRQVLVKHVEKTQNIYCVFALQKLNQTAKLK